MKASTKDIIKRQLLIIELLLSGKYVSSSDIMSHLADNDIPTKLRTVQRDMVMLEDILPIESRKDDKPYSWRWQPTVTDNSSGNQMNLSQAIALRLVETELKSIIPTDLYAQLQPLFMKANFLAGLTEWRRTDELSQLQALSEANIGEELKNTSDGGFTNVTNQRLKVNKKGNIIPRTPLHRIIETLRMGQGALKKSLPNRAKSAKNADLADKPTPDVTLSHTDPETIENLQDVLNQEGLDWLAELLRSGEERK